MSDMKAPKSSPSPLPPSALDELRRWRMQASVRFVSKSRKANGWDTYIARLAQTTGRPVAVVDREEAARILEKRAARAQRAARGGK